MFIVTKPVEGVFPFLHAVVHWIHWMFWRDIKSCVHVVLSLIWM